MNLWCCAYGWAWVDCYCVGFCYWLCCGTWVLIGGLVFEGWLSS